MRGLLTGVAALVAEAQALVTGSVAAARTWDLLRPGIKPASLVGRQILNPWITGVAQYFAAFYFEFSLTQTRSQHSSHITVTELSKFKAQRGRGGISVSITFGFPPRHLDSSTSVVKNSPLSTK